MKFEMRPRDKRALIFLALALGIYVGADWFILPAYDRLAAASDLAAEKENQLKRYRRAELRKGQYEELLKVANERLAKSESALIPAGNLSLASAEMQSLVEGAANRVGLMPGLRLMGNARRVNDIYAELPMTMNFESTPGQLVSFLNELHSVPRFVTVRTLQITPVTPVFEAPKGSDLTKAVRVSMAVSAFTFADLVKPQGGSK
jgi:Tfp pilus assembly protein PilO